MRLLRIGSPLFHFGILFVLVGHIVGLLIPMWLTEAVGVTQELYHLNALLVGGIAGFWATQVLPFADPTSLNAYLDLETATYAALGGGA